MIFHWSLSDNKSPQISRTFLDILADFNNAVIWMFSTHPVISKSSSPFINPLVTVPRAPIIIGINITFMFHSFQFSSKVELQNPIGVCVSHSSGQMLGYVYTICSYGQI